MFKSLKVAFVAVTSFSFCFAFSQDNSIIDGHPAWIMQGNIYEVNVRQYTPEGTFKAFEKSLPRLKKMGIQTLWFMPINPISKIDRKGSLGSYYAIANYKAVNPEFGTIDDWKSLVEQCHKLGFKVIIDWVANHTGADNYWLTAHPDFYVLDSTGHPASQFDWTDTRKLNYNNPAVGDSMIDCMKFWIDSTGIDGFRCDYAVGPTKSFWEKCIQTLRADKNLFMLAESDSAWLNEAGFDATYAWPQFHTMVDIVSGKKNALSLDSIVNVINTTFPANALQLYFTSNHDENSWNKADYGTMPGASHAPFAVLTQTLPRSIPLIYSGQEEPFLDSISFFYKDTINFHNYARAHFYNQLLHLREMNDALAANAAYKKLLTSDDKNIFAFMRQNGNNKLLVIVNLSNQPQHFTINDATINGKPVNIFSSEKEKISNRQIMDFEAWAYKVYTY
ncbi:MAG: alpha-glucosidase C-terminal domain-containing protein [Bacteroidetes bacterium]|nr:alpha-glucosidase C-terminal domain-containing protein [Bacteroidota bacterium]